MMGRMRNYTRWRETEQGGLEADLLGLRIRIFATPATGLVDLTASVNPMTPDEARMIGVRLIEAAALADGDRAIRRSAEDPQ